MEHLVAILVPIACGCVLPIVIIWLGIREKMNESKNRTQIVLAAIEKNPDMDVEELMKKISPKKKLLKEKLLSKLQTGSIATFLAQKAHFTDNDAFMVSLTKRLDAVEYIKLHQEATIRRYKMVMVAVFVVGIISGAITISYLLSAPIDEPLFSFTVQTGVLLWLSENSRLIAATALSLLMTFGIVSIFSNVQDIHNILRHSFTSSVAGDC